MSGRLEQVPVFHVARRVTENAQKLQTHAARGDQDEVLKHALLTMSLAAIVAHRMGDPIGEQLLELIEQANPENEGWDGRARARAYLESALQE